MRIFVCIKQVPDSAQIRVHPVTNTIMRQGVPTIINPYDLFGLEEALRLRDRFGGEVTVMTMGPPMASDSLRKALTYGADRAVLLTDRFFAGSDTLATSYALANLIQKASENWGQPDIVFCGKQTIDGDTAQVGPGIARRLGLTQLTYVSSIDEIDPSHGTITVRRRADHGVQVLQSRLPAMITMMEGSNEIRRGRIEDALRAASAEVVQWNAAAAGITDLGHCGLRGSPTVVKKVFAPPSREEKATLVGEGAANPAAVANDLITQIFARQPVLEGDLMHAAARH
ncbi:electron transfer flavoprotein subunit beta/FixA family protein [Gluconacetobacter johannae]|uniref:Electron transfer flavoprotein subunit beta/FixA family protein n=1 Tax=Gluconacetobacter johannae TaxID=112140 RepID=A0A7W4P2Y4_9PROT|nr:electron transfer flavoprotein subunit beta/FixA family protein [Gluconacetobacter johannae]MBB2175631.1 electron transfer flavoprotein subunit beta/FixA family protein [Gluconacetobacter johannae]